MQTLDPCFSFLGFPLTIQLHPTPSLGCAIHHVSQVAQCAHLWVGLGPLTYQSLVPGGWSIEQIAPGGPDTIFIVQGRSVQTQWPRVTHTVSVDKVTDTLGAALVCRVVDG